MTAIDFDNVTFEYQSACPLLKKASFRVESGEFIGVIGPNGGGKTTALKLMLGLLKPSSGGIKIFKSPPKRARARIGYVPQSNTYDKQFPISCLEVVLTGVVSRVSWFGTLGKEDKEKGLNLLKKMGAQHLKDRPFGTLSGGQAQKILLARALISDPDLLLLDEPTANIDTQSEAFIFSFLKSLKGKKTILIVMHDFDAILKHTERILCFQKEVSSLKKEEVCKHFTIGMYHPTKMQEHNG